MAVLLRAPRNASDGFIAGEQYLENRPLRHRFKLELGTNIGDRTHVLAKVEGGIRIQPNHCIPRGGHAESTPGALAQAQQSGARGTEIVRSDSLHPSRMI